MTFARVLGASLLLLLLSCAPEVATLAIDLDEVPADVARLEIGIALPGDTDPRPTRTLGATRSFDVHLPPNAMGEVHLWIDGLGPEGCRNARVEHTVMVTGIERQPLALHLAPEAGCLLHVDRVGTGSGRVAVDAGGLRCEDWSQPCERRFPGRDRTVTLSATATDRESYFLGWTGQCHGTSSCVLDVAPGMTTVGAMFLPRQLCGEEGWCWQRPRPTGEDIYRIWGSSSEDLWALGDNGLILRGDGRVFAPLPRQTSARLEDVRGSGPNDVWAVGTQGTILRFRGTAWETVDSGTDVQLNGLWVFDAKHAYAVGARGTILRWDGTRWSARRPASTDTLTAIWGTRRQHGGVDLWMVGTGGVVVRGDGEDFRVIDKRGLALHDIWGYNASGSDDPEVIWAVGANCTAIRYPDRYTISSSESGCVLRGIWGSSPEDIWVAGTGGTIYRLRGTILHTSYLNQNASNARNQGFYSVWGSGPSDVWFAGSGGAIMRHNGVALTPFGPEVDHALVGVFALSQDNVWAVGDRSLFRSRQGSWVPTRILSVALTPYSLHEVWASSDTDVWIAGQSTTGALVMRFDGNNGVYEDTTTDDGAYTRIWGSGAGDVWAGGTHGRMVHFTPGLVARNMIVQATREWVITGIAGRGASEVYFTGIAYRRSAQGLLIPDKSFGAFWDGSQLLSHESPPGGAVNRLYFHPATGYVAVGAKYVTTDGVTRELPWIVRHPGRPGTGAWIVEPVEGTEQALFGVFGTSLADLRAVGANGVIVARGEDGRWRAQPRMASSSLHAIHGLPSGEMWAVGDGGSVLHRPAKAE